MFSVTVAVASEVNTGAVSLTSRTVTVTLAVPVAPLASVAVTTSAWLAAVSRSSDRPAARLIAPVCASISNSPPGLPVSVKVTMSPSGVSASVAVTVAITTVSAMSSATLAFAPVATGASLRISSTPTAVPPAKLTFSMPVSVVVSPARVSV